MEYSKIYQLLDKKKVTINQLAGAIKMSHPGLTKALNNNSLRIDTLEKIASFLEVPIFSFFTSNEDEQSQEANFDYLKNNLIASGLVKLNPHFLIYDIRKSLKVSEAFIAKMKRLIPKDDLNFIFSNSKSLVPTSELINNRDNYIFEFMPVIQKYAIHKSNEELLKELENEFFILFKEFVDKVVSDKSVKFIREEALCDDRDLIYILQSIYESDFGNGSAEMFIGYMSNYFNKNDIHFDTSKYF